MLETAKAKLDKKNADFIIANEAKTALNTYENEVWIIDKAGNTCHIEKNSKEKTWQSHTGASFMIKTDEIISKSKSTPLLI